jgi:hypothetical protein
MAKLVYAKNNQILASTSGIPAEGDTVIVENVKALEDYKLIYEAEGSKEGARVVLGSKTGIPAEGDDTIYEAKEETEDKTEDETETPVPAEPDEPATNEPGIETPEEVEGGEF